MTEYANRGKGLERAIRKLFESYQSRGIHCQQNHPEQLFDGKGYGFWDGCGNGYGFGNGFGNGIGNRRFEINDKKIMET